MKAGMSACVRACVRACGSKDRDKDGGIWNLECGMWNDADADADGGIVKEKI